MNARKYYPVILGSCLAILAASVGVPVNAAAQADTQATATAAPAKSKHAKKQSTTQARRDHGMAASTRESPYQTALRRCVTGQAQQRDQCVDDAIARYGRS